MSLKSCEIFLDNTLEDSNFSVTSDEIVQFVEILRDNLITSKKHQDVCNKIYPLVRNVLLKALVVKERMEGDGSTVSSLHVFNDMYHPLRFAT